ncbi:MAG: T9SS type A sorting domain-containing protein [Bacteroidetes bacterium]|nr:T9SS type A sorting domain-containing protein [Bacteroidota bacterium]
MKKITTVLILSWFFIFNSNLKAQWSSVSSSTLYDIYDIQFLNAYDIFLAGDDGLTKSSDGGYNWSILPLVDNNGTSMYASGLRTVHFFDNYNGVATGLMYMSNNECMLKTTNGGANWTITYLTNNIGIFHKIHFPNNNTLTAYAVGENGRILKTTNGGNSWVSQNSGITADLKDVFFTSTQTGFATGGNFLLSTNNGGSSWQSANFGYQVNNVKFINSTTGYIGAANKILKTTNSGSTWDTINKPPYYASYKIYPKDADTLIAIAGNMAFITKNGGFLWEKQNSIFTTQLNDFETYNWQKSILVGEDGKIYKTENAGGTPYPIASFSFPNNTICKDSTINFINNSSNTYNYHWLFNGVPFSSAYNSAYVFHNPDQYDTISLIANNGYNTDTYSTSLYVQPSLDFNLSFQLSSDTVCYNTQDTIKIPNSVNGVTYKIKDANSLVISSFYGNSDLVKIPTVNLTNTVNYTIEATKINSCGTNTKTLPIHIEVSKPNINLPFYAQDTIVCSGDSSYIKLENSESGTIYQLYSSYQAVGQAQTGNGGTLTFRLGPASTKTYQLTATNTRGCQITFTRNITITPRSLNVYFTLLNGFIMFGDTLKITNSSNADSYKWVIDTNFSIPISTNENPILTFNTQGRKKLTLIGNTIQGCTQKRSIDIEVLQPTVSGNITRCNFVEQSVDKSPTITDYFVDNNKNHYYIGYKNISSYNNPGIFLEKRDSMYNSIFYKEIACTSTTNNTSFPTSIATDSKGNIYLTGHFFNNLINIGPFSINCGSHSFINSFIVKYDNIGQEKWVIYSKINSGSTSTSMNGFFFSDISINKDDRIFVSGANYENVRNTINFTDNSNIELGIGVNNRDGFLLEIDSNGVKKDFANFGGIYYSRITAYESKNEINQCIGINPKIIADSAGNVKIAGSFNKRYSNPEPFVFGNFQLNDSSAVFVATYNKTTGWKSAKSIVKGAQFGPIKQFKYDENNNYFLSGSVDGYFKYNTDTVFTDFNPFPVNGGVKYSYLIKSDSIGNHNYYYTSPNNNISDFELMGNGDVLALFNIPYVNYNGATQNTLGIKNSQNQYYGRKTLGAKNYLFANINSTGSLISTNIFNGYKDDIGYFIRKDKCGDVYAITRENINSLTTNYNGYLMISKFATDGVCIKQNCVAVNFTDAAIINKNNWNSFATQNTISTSIPIINKGNTIINTIKVRVKNNLLTDTLISWTGSLQPNDTVLITFNSVPLYQGGNNLSIVIDSVLPNIDQNHTNDTIETFIYRSAPLNGIYTIGQDNISDFPDVVSSANALNNLGISGAVTFIIKPGTYYDPILFSKINGVSATKRITYKSLNNDSTSVVLSNSTGNQFGDYVIRIDTTNYLTFRHLTIRNNSLLQNASTILINGNSNYLQFKNNIIASKYQIENYNFSLINAPVYNSFTNNITIANNLFENGNNGVRFWNGSYSSKSDSLIICNNIFKNNITSNINIFYIKNSIFSNNILQSANCIYLRNCINLTISNNIIRASNNAIYLSDDFDNSDIINNIIISENGYCIFADGAGYFNVYNNTMLARIGSCTYYMNPDGIKHSNNIFASLGSQSCVYGTNYATYQVSSDYNTYYSLAGNNAFASLTAFQNFQQTNQRDLHSKFYLPQFKSYNDLHILNDTTIRNKGVFLPDVLTDIDGDIRDTLPDIGADEFSITTAPPTLTVWPGDANADHIVDYLDIFPLGVYYGEFGIPRQNTMNNWQAKDAYQWNQIQQNAANLCHADCNGDGIINEADTLIIYKNFNLNHGQTNTQPSNLVNIPINYEISKPIYLPGDTIKLSIILGDSILQADSLYGLGISIGVINKNNIDTNTISNIFNPSWITNIQPIVSINAIDKFNAQIQSVKVRTNKTNALSGHGSITLLSLKLKSANLDDTLKIEIKSIIGTNKNGGLQNFGSKTIKIPVDTLGLPAAAGNISGLTAICQGQNNIIYSVPLINKATSYIWTLPSGASGSSSMNTIIVNYGTSAVSGNISVKGHNSSGDGISSILAITVNSIPPAPIITLTGTTLSSNATNCNQWYNLATGLIPSATATTYNPAQNGNYFSIVTINGCLSDSSNILYCNYIGINDIYSIADDFYIYPNPVKENLIIELKGNKILQNTSVSIYTIHGQLLKQITLKENKTVIDTHSFASGVYIIKLNDEKEKFVSSFLKE